MANIKALIDALKSQGNQVDIGGFLSTILNAIVERQGSLVWDISSLGEISEETEITEDVLASYCGQQVLITEYNHQPKKLLFSSVTADYLVYTDGIALTLWVYLNGKVKPADHD